MSDQHFAATALMRHHDYSEAEDSVEWLRLESADVAAAIIDGPDAVYAVLLDTAYVDPSDADSVAAGRAVCRDLCGSNPGGGTVWRLDKENDHA